MLAILSVVFCKELLRLTGSLAFYAIGHRKQGLADPLSRICTRSSTVVSTNPLTGSLATHSALQFPTGTISCRHSGHNGMLGTMLLGGITGTPEGD